MNGPDLTAGPVCCRDCGQPVKIVCDAHGTDCVLDLRPLPPQATAIRTATTREIRAAQVAIKDGTHRRLGVARARVLEVISPDPERPTTTGQVADLLGMKMPNASFQLAELVRMGLALRIRHVHYARVPHRPA